MPLVRRLLTLAGIHRGDRVVDIGTGSGIVAFEAAKTGARITGIDISAGLLAQARSKISPDAAPAFVRMDAERLAFADASFDAALSLFAVTHFPDPVGALREVFRIVRPGGRAVIAVGSSPPLSLGGIAHRFGRLPDLLAESAGRLLIAPRFLEQLLASRSGPAAGSEETDFAARSGRRTGSLVSLLKQTGFQKIQTHWEGHRESFTDVELFWIVQSVYSSIARKRLAALSAHERVAIKQGFQAQCMRVLQRGGQLVYPHAAFFAIAVRPET